MLHPGSLRCPRKVADLGRVLGDLPAGGAVQDDLGTLDGGLDPLVFRQVADDVLDARPGVAWARRLSTRTFRPAS